MDARDPSAVCGTQCITALLPDSDWLPQVKLLVGPPVSYGCQDERWPQGQQVALDATNGAQLPTQEGYDRTAASLLSWELF